MAFNKIAEAPIIWNVLNGLINVYKPAAMSINHLRMAIFSNLCTELNSMEVRPPRKRLMIDKCEQMDGAAKYLVRTETDLSDHVLAIGPRYQNDDFNGTYGNYLGTNSSGVLVLGINDGTRIATRLRRNRLLRVYHVSGCLGVSTETNFKGSRIVSKANYRHVYDEKLSKLLASMQASHQRKMFEQCGVDIQSQSAYNLAVQGLIRPTDGALPVIYGIRCILFRKPEFTLEIHAINETEEYLCNLIQEIGIQMHTIAHCTQIRCVKFGPFTVEHTLLRRMWTLQSIFNNMQECNNILKNNADILKHISADITAD